MKHYGIPFFIGGSFNGRSHPMLMMEPLPPYFDLVTSVSALPKLPDYNGTERFTARVIALRKDLILHAYVYSEIEDEDAASGIMEMMVNRLDFVRLTD